MRKLLTGLALALLACAPLAQAGMISPAPASERERVMALVERPEVAQQLQALGIPADQAKARVQAMSEAEVASLAGKLDALPAGGALNNQDFLFIIIVILLVALIL
ncbi:MAG: PA2779 family protein [Clostridia bacterium]